MVRELIALLLLCTLLLGTIAQTTPTIQTTLVNPAAIYYPGQEVTISYQLDLPVGTVSPSTIVDAGAQLDLMVGTSGTSEKAVRRMAHSLTLVNGNSLSVTVNIPIDLPTPTTNQYFFRVSHKFLGLTFGDSVTFEIGAACNVYNQNRFGGSIAPQSITRASSVHCQHSVVNPEGNCYYLNVAITSLDSSDKIKIYEDGDAVDGGKLLRVFTSDHTGTFKVLTSSARMLVDIQQASASSTFTINYGTAVCNIPSVSFVSFDLENPVLVYDEDNEIVWKTTGDHKYVQVNLPDAAPQIVAGDRTLFHPTSGASNSISINVIASPTTAHSITGIQYKYRPRLTVSTVEDDTISFIATGFQGSRTMRLFRISNNDTSAALVMNPGFTIPNDQLVEVDTITVSPSNTVASTTLTSAVPEHYRDHLYVLAIAADSNTLPVYSQPFSLRWQDTNVVSRGMEAQYVRGSRVLIKWTATTTHYNFMDLIVRGPVGFTDVTITRIPTFDNVAPATGSYYWDMPSTVPFGTYTFTLHPNNIDQDRTLFTETTAVAEDCGEVSYELSSTIGNSHTFGNQYAGEQFATCRYFFNATGCNRLSFSGVTADANQQFEFYSTNDDTLRYQFNGANVPAHINMTDFYYVVITGTFSPAGDANAFQLTMTEAACPSTPVAPTIKTGSFAVDQTVVPFGAPVMLELTWTLPDVAINTVNINVFAPSNLNDVLVSINNIDNNGLYLYNLTRSEVNAMIGDAVDQDNMYIFILTSADDAEVNGRVTVQFVNPQSVDYTFVEPNAASVLYWKAGDRFALNILSNAPYDHNVIVQLFDGPTQIATIGTYTVTAGPMMIEMPALSLIRGNNYRLRAVDSSDANIVRFSQDFTIIPVTNGFTVVDPTSRQVITPFTNLAIRWHSDKTLEQVTRVSIFVYSSFDVLLYTVVENTANTGYYEWEVPADFPLGGSHYRVVVRSEEAGTKFGISQPVSSAEPATAPSLLYSFSDVGDFIASPKTRSSKTQVVLAGSEMTVAFIATSTNAFIDYPVIDVYLAWYNVETGVYEYRKKIAGDYKAAERNTMKYTPARNMLEGTYAVVIRPSNTSTTISVQSDDFSLVTPLYITQKDDFSINVDEYSRRDHMYKWYLKNTLGTAFWIRFKKFNLRNVDSLTFMRRDPLNHHFVEYKEYPALNIDRYQDSGSDEPLELDDLNFITPVEAMDSEMLIMLTTDASDDQMSVPTKRCQDGFASEIYMPTFLTGTKGSFLSPINRTVANEEIYRECYNKTWTDYEFTYDEYLIDTCTNDTMQYGNNIGASWLITAPQRDTEFTGQCIWLTFTMIDMENYNPGLYAPSYTKSDEGPGDLIQVYDGAFPRVEKAVRMNNVGFLTGEDLETCELPLPYQSIGNQLYVSFRTDQRNTRKGFAARYETVTCKEQLTEESGTFELSRTEYKPTMKKTWFITPERDQKGQDFCIWLTVDSFDIADDDELNVYDYERLTTGDIVTNKIATFTRNDGTNKLYYPVQSTKRVMKVEFSSKTVASNSYQISNTNREAGSTINRDLARSGFTAHYSVAPCNVHVENVQVFDSANLFTAVDTIYENRTYVIQWTTRGMIPSVDIELHFDQSTATFRKEYTIASDVANVGSYSFVLPDGYVFDANNNRIKILVKPLNSRFGSASSVMLQSGATVTFLDNLKGKTLPQTDDLVIRYIWTGVHGSDWTYTLLRKTWIGFEATTTTGLLGSQSGYETVALAAVPQGIYVVRLSGASMYTVTSEEFLVYQTPAAITTGHGNTIVPVNMNAPAVVQVTVSGLINVVNARLTLAGTTVTTYPSFNLTELPYVAGFWKFDVPALTVGENYVLTLSATEEGTGTSVSTDVYFTAHEECDYSIEEASGYITLPSTNRDINSFPVQSCKWTYKNPCGTPVRVKVDTNTCQSVRFYTNDAAKTLLQSVSSSFSGIIDNSEFVVEYTGCPAAQSSEPLLFVSYSSVGSCTGNHVFFKSPSSMSYWLTQGTYNAHLKVQGTIPAGSRMRLINAVTNAVAQEAPFDAAATGSVAKSLALTAAAGRYFLRVSDANGNVLGTSKVFDIRSNTGATRIDVGAVAASVNVGQEVTVSWTITQGTVTVNSVHVDLYTSGVFTQRIAHDITETSFKWTVPRQWVNYVNSDSHQFVVVAKDTSVSFGESSPFSIADVELSLTNLQFVNTHTFMQIQDASGPFGNDVFDQGLSVDGSVKDIILIPGSQRKYRLSFEKTGYIPSVTLQLFDDKMRAIEIGGQPFVSNSLFDYQMLTDNQIEFSLKQELNAYPSDKFHFALTSTVHTHIRTVSAPFSISPLLGDEKLKILYPNNDGLVWYGASTHPIQWTSAGYYPFVTIRLKSSSGVNILVASQVANNGLYSFTTPLNIARRTDYFFEISASHNATLVTRGALLTIQPLTKPDPTNPNKIVVTTPFTANTNATSGETMMLEFSREGSVGSVEIILLSTKQDVMTTVATRVEGESIVITLPMSAPTGDDYEFLIRDEVTPSTFVRTAKFFISAPAFKTLSIPHNDGIISSASKSTFTLFSAVIAVAVALLSMM